MLTPYSFITLDFQNKLSHTYSQNFCLSITEVLATEIIQNNITDLHLPLGESQILHHII